MKGYGSTLDGVLCGVFDGHGEYGHVVSKAASRRLPLLLLNQKNAVLSSEVPTESQSTNCNGSSSLDKELVEWKTAFLNAFKEMDDEVMKMALKERYFTSGSTAVVALKQVCYITMQTNIKHLVKHFIISVLFGSTCFTCKKQI